LITDLGFFMKYFEDREPPGKNKQVLANIGYFGVKWGRM
jgi:hypothetical protein